MAKIALLIGVSDYPQDLPEAQRLKPLPKAVPDAEAVAQALGDPALGGFQVTLLRNPSKAEMETAVNQAFSTTRAKDDLILLYFSGHGVKDLAGRFYLTSKDSRKESDGNLHKASALSAAVCHDLLRDCPARRKVVILDSCLSAAFSDGMSFTKDDGQVDLKAALGGEGVALLSSSGSTELSYERRDGELSVYTHYLLEGIHTGAADRNEDGKIDVGEAHDYAYDKTREEAPSMNPRLFLGMKDKPIVLAQAPRTLSKLHYAREMERRIQEGDGKISPIGRKILEQKRIKLGLGKAEASEIEERVFITLRRRQKKLKEYADTLRLAWQNGAPGTVAQRELDYLQKLLDLYETEVTPLVAEHKRRIEEQKTKEEVQRKAEAERQRRETEVKRKAEKERDRQEAEAKKKTEEEARRKAVEEWQRREAEEKRKAEEERRRQEVEAKKKAEEEAKRLAEERRQYAQAEALRITEEQRRLRRTGSTTPGTELSFLSWHPIFQLKMLWRILFVPQTMLDCHEKDSRLEEETKGWLITNLIWLPILFPIISFSLLWQIHAEEPFTVINYRLLLLVIIIAWLVMGNYSSDATRIIASIVYIVGILASCIAAVMINNNTNIAYTFILDFDIFYIKTRIFIIPIGIGTGLSVGVGAALRTYYGYKGDGVIEVIGPFSVIFAISVCISVGMTAGVYGMAIFFISMFLIVIRSIYDSILIIIISGVIYLVSYTILTRLVYNGDFVFFVIISYISMAIVYPLIFYVVDRSLKNGEFSVIARITFIILIFSHAFLWFYYLGGWRVLA